MALNGTYQATEKLLLNAGFTYNHAKDSWDWDFGDRPQLEWSGGPKPNYDNTDGYNNLIDSYSDLTYEQYQTTVGATYQFTEALYASASFTYDVFNAKEEYVYGDEDGKAFSGYAGVGYRF